MKRSPEIMLLLLFLATPSMSQSLHVSVIPTPYDLGRLSAQPQLTHKEPVIVPQLMERFEPEPEVVAATDKKKLELPLHPVEAHRRLLPPGYQPSANALALAEELGITLEPGETVVKKHNRGDEKFGVVAHRGKQRRK